MEKSLERFALSAAERAQLHGTGFLAVRSPSDLTWQYWVDVDGSFTWLYVGGKLVRLLDARPDADLSAVDAVIALKLLIVTQEKDFLTKAKSYSIATATPQILRLLYSLVKVPPVAEWSVPSLC